MQGFKTHGGVSKREGFPQSMPPSLSSWKRSLGSPGARNVDLLHNAGIEKSDFGREDHLLRGRKGGTAFSSMQAGHWGGRFSSPSKAP